MSCEKYFEVIVLHTDTKQGDVFYTANGFVKGDYIGIKSLQSIIEIAIQTIATERYFR